MKFFDVIATPGLGKKKENLKGTEIPYGQAQISINANASNGNLFVKDITKKFIAQGFQFNLGYQYNSQSQLPWRFNQSKVIGSIQGKANEIHSFVVVEEPDGHESTYTYDSDRRLYVNLSEVEGSSVLSYTPEGQWVGWNPSNNIQEFYNQTNQLEKMTDTSGNYLTFKYDADGRLIAISGNSGQKIAIEYHPQTTSIYSFNGDKKTLEMQYLLDEGNRLLKTLIPLTSNEHYEINYDYSDTSGLLESIKQSDHTEVRLSYEKKGNRYLLSTLSNGTGNKFFVHYEKNSTRVIDALNNEDILTLNNAGLLEKHTYRDQYQKYNYDAVNRVKSIQYQDGSVQVFCYDALGCYSELTGRSDENILYSRDGKTGLLRCETQVLSSDDGEK